MTKILLIEDDLWLAESYCQTLEEYEVDIASDADRALDCIDQTDYEVVIADVILEKNLVFDLLHELQSYDDTSQLPIILCTSLADRIELDDVREYGVVEVLEKSTLTPKILREAVENALE